MFLWTTWGLLPEQYMALSVKEGKRMYAVNSICFLYTSLVVFRHILK